MSDKVFLSSKTTFEDIFSWKKSDIKNCLKENNLKTSGNKSTLAKRVYVHIHSTLQSNLADDLNLNGNDIDSEIPDINNLNFGWTSDKKQLPKITHNDIEKYLIYSSHRTEDKAKMQCYRQFIRGYNFHKEGYIHKLMVNEIDKADKNCFIRSKCFPSMKKDVIYEQWILMTKISPFNILKAYCTCPAGLGEGCTHVAGLLFEIEACNQEENTPCTSKPCTWNKPLKRKSVPEKVSDISFKRIKFDDTRISSPKKKPKSCAIHKENFLSNLCNRLGDSNAVLFHLSNQTFGSEINYKPEDDINVGRWEEVTSSLYTQSKAEKYIDLKSMINDGDLSSTEFLNLLNSISSSETEEIELKTRGQSENPLWMKTRQGRLTASSNFHDIKIRKPSTPDTKLVDAIVSDVVLNSNVPSLEWGKKTRTNC